MYRLLAKSFTALLTSSSVKALAKASIDFLIFLYKGVELIVTSSGLYSLSLKCLTLTAAGLYLPAALGISMYILPSFWLISIGLMIKSSLILPLVDRIPFFTIPKIELEDTLGISPMFLSSVL